VEAPVVEAPLGPLVEATSVFAELLPVLLPLLMGLLRLAVASTRRLGDCLECLGRCAGAWAVPDLSWEEVEVEEGEDEEPARGVCCTRSMGSGFLSLCSWALPVARTGSAPGQYKRKLPVRAGSSLYPEAARAHAAEA